MNKSDDAAVIKMLQGELMKASDTILGLEGNLAVHIDMLMERYGIDPEAPGYHEDKFWVRAMRDEQRELQKVASHAWQLFEMSCDGLDELRVRARAAQGVCGE